LESVCDVLIENGTIELYIDL